MAERVLVTGGAGYIGSHACKALAAAGYEPVTYDNLSIGNRWAVRWGPLEQGDVLDAERLAEICARHRPVGVLHFAALSLVGESVRRPGAYWRTGLAGTLNVAEAAFDAGAEAFVLSSTCAVYGMPERMPIREDAPCAPINPYGAVKLAAERMLADLAAAHGHGLACLRYFNAAGADPEGEIGECRPVETHLVPLMLDAILGRAPPLTVMGTDYPTPDGTAIRDYIHVSDLAEAHVAALRRLLSGAGGFTANLGTGTGLSVRQMLAAAETAAGRRVPHTTGPRRAGDAPELVADPAHARNLLGAPLTPRSDPATLMATAWAWHASAAYAQARAAR